MEYYIETNAIEKSRTAYSVSPVIGLGVLVGNPAENPAENLYRKLGFIAQPSFTDLTFKL